MSDVEQHTGVVPPMLGLTKSIVSDLQLTVLLGGWAHTSVEDGILMPQPLELLHDGPSGVALEVEQVLRVPIQQSHPHVEVRGPRGQAR
jgi:hypothetical protein